MKQDSNPASPLSIVLGKEVENYKISIPPMLKRNVDRLHWLDEPAGPSVFYLISKINAFNAKVDLGVAGYGDMPVLEAAITDARKQVEKIYRTAKQR